MNPREKGYTTIELMVAISLSLIFIGFVYSVYHFSIRLTRSWDEKINLENQALICMDRLNRDLITASEILIYGTDTLAVLIQNKQIGYGIRNGDLFRNSFRINSDKFTISQFVVNRDTSRESDENKLSESEFISALSSEKNRDMPFVFTIQFTVTGPKKQLTLHSAIHSRNVDKMIYKTL